MIYKKLFNRYLPLTLSVLLLVAGSLVYLFLKNDNKAADAAWYSASWTYRKPITIDHNKVSGVASSTINSFPILISVTDTDLKYTGNGGKVASTTGADILFTDSNGTTKLDHEIESYSSSTGQLIAWVRIPILHATFDDTIYIYFGNSGSGDQSSSTNVWDSNYKGVWHLKENPAGTFPPLKDSTSNAKHLGVQGSGGSQSSVAGKIGNAFNNNKNGQYSTLLASSTPTTGMGTGDGSIEGWVYLNSIISPTDQNQQQLFGRIRNSPYPYSYFTLGLRDNGKLFSVTNQEGVLSTNTPSSLTTGQWYYLALSRASNTVKIYINGSVDVTDTDTYSQLDDGAFMIGAMNLSYIYGADAKYDELRMSSSARNNDWFATEYNNQSSPSTFYAYGALSIVSSSPSSNTAGAGAGWYSASWSYRKPITIDHNKVGGTSSSTLNSFPLLVSVTDSDLKYTGSGGKMASSTAGDLLFTAGDGTTKLDFELEKYSSSTGQTIAWVRIPILHATSDDTIYIYFGNGSATNQQNPTGVWDSNYKGVWHLPNGTTLTANDSTSNAVNATSQTGVSAATGKIAGAASDDGVFGHYIDFGDKENITGTNISASGWMKRLDNSLYFILLGRNGTGGAAVPLQYQFTWLHSSESPANGFRFNWDDSGGTLHTVNSTGIITDSNWHYIFFTYDGSNVKIYLDGNLDTTSSQSSNFSISLTGPAFRMFTDTPRGTASANGLLDEVRISNTSRSDDWVKTEYNNQSSPATFYSYGALQTPTKTTRSGFGSQGASTLGWYSSSWSYRKPITIDHNKVGGTSSSTLNSFPLLVNVIDSDLKYTGSGGKMASSTAGDLLFTASDGTTKLDFELEKYSSSTGQTIAWVRIPILHATYDDTIYIYFGNASATNQQNPTAVWDSNYTGVWHFGNGTTLNLNDSTSNAYTLTNDSTTATSTGQIYGASGWNANNTLSRSTNSNLSSVVFTYSGWVNITDTSVHNMLLQPETGATLHLLGARFGQAWNGSAWKNRLQILALGEFVVGESNTYMDSNTLYYITMTYDASGNYAFYLNGAPDGSGTNYTDFSGGSGNFLVGYYVVKGLQNFSGMMDELRTSKVVRSADWVKTEYNNQSSPSSFYGYGQLQTITRQTSGGASQPAVKSRGGVRFR